MIIVWALSWWYGAGWKGHILAVRRRLWQTADYFSLQLLIRNLFSPFRQISAGSVSGSIAVKWRAFVDRLISRVIGAIVRTFTILIGSVWMGVQALFGGISIVVWAIIPGLPIIGLIVTLSGWVPSWQ